MNASRLNELTEAYLDRRLKPAELAELESLLRSNPACRQLFLQHTSFEGLLHEWGRMSLYQKTNKPQHPRSTRPRVIGIAMALSAAALAIFMLTHHASPTSFPHGIAPNATDVAVLTQSENAKWQHDSQSPTLGQFIKTGSLSLESGAAVIEFENGQELTINGKASFPIVNSNKISCSDGIFSLVNSSPDDSFSIETPTGKISDINGHIAIHVDEKQTDILVDEGQATINPRHGNSVPANTGSTWCMHNAFAKHDISSNENSMRDVLQLSDQLRAGRQSPPGHWLLANQELNRDPSLLLRLVFDDMSSGDHFVPNQAHSGVTSDSIIVGGRLDTGRWPGKRAFAFDQPLDGLNISVGGVYQTISMTAWVNIDTFDHDYNGLFMSDGIKPGGFHWQFRRSGALEVGVLKHTSPSYMSPVVIQPSDFGKWLHVAVVYDLPQHMISHFLNGRLVHRSELLESRLVIIRNAMIGNWNPADDYDKEMIRNFRGKIDEFAIYQRVLTDREIRRLYESGKPNRR